jgi:hypothetical protein
MRKSGRGEIKKIGDLFEVYRKKLRAPEKSVIDTALEVIHDLIPQKLTRSMCSYSPHSRILTIRASGLIKTEIMLRKKEILAHLEGRLGSKSTPHEII